MYIFYNTGNLLRGRVGKHHSILVKWDTVYEIVGGIWNFILQDPGILNKVFVKLVRNFNFLSFWFGKVFIGALLTLRSMIMGEITQMSQNENAAC